MIQGPIPIVEYADAVPQLGILLWVGEEVQRLLIGRVGLLQVVLHEVAVSKRTPYFSVVLLDSKHALEVVDCLGVVLFDPSDARNLCQSRHGRRIMPQCILVCGKGMFEISHLLGNPSD
jgi:hypothetical protein